MWSPGNVRVISSQSFVSSALNQIESTSVDGHETAGSILQHPAVKLKELLDSPEWMTAVENSPMADYYLISISYNTFISSPRSRVLSYRWNNKLTLNCTVKDPAGIVIRFKGDLALSVLQTPTTYSEESKEGWDMLWADALNHLNHPPSIQYTIKTMGDLYLQAITLPQYFLIGDIHTAQEAIRRGWMHQELAYGRLDRYAVNSFIGMCAKAMPTTRWRGNPAHIPSYILLSEFVSKRLTSSTKELPLNSLFHQVLHYTSKLDYVTCCLHILSLWRIAHDLPATDLHGTTKETAQTILEEYLNEIITKQVSDDITVNQQLLDTSASFCWCILRAAANVNFWDKSDIYVASIAIIGRACGIDILDPLAEYKAKFEDSHLHPTNRDGTWRYCPSDLNLTVLNRNNTILQRCWRTLGKEDGYANIPNGLRPISDDQMVLINLHTMPYGMHTMGVGPILTASIPTVNSPIEADKKRRLKVIAGKFGMNFTLNLDYYEIRVLRDDDYNLNHSSEQSELLVPHMDIGQEHPDRLLFHYYHAIDVDYIQPIVNNNNTNVSNMLEHDRNCICSEVNDHGIPKEFRK